MRRMTAILAIMSIGFIGCGGSSPSEDASSTGSESGGGAAVLAGDASLDIGDVEQGIRITATLAEKSSDAGIQNEEIIDLSKRVNLVTLTVDGPRDSLWLTLKTEPRRVFTKNPVAIEVMLRTDVKMPGDESLITNRAPLYKGLFVTRTREDYYLVEFDVLDGVSGRPETMLAQMEVTAIMTPVGTDPETIDIENFEAIEGQRTHLLGNPVRINFVN